MFYSTNWERYLRNRTGGTVKHLKSASQTDWIHSTCILFINLPLSFNSVDDRWFPEVFMLIPVIWMKILDSVIRSFVCCFFVLNMKATKVYFSLYTVHMSKFTVSDYLF